MALRPWSCPKVTRNVEAKGTITSSAKAPPERKSSEPMITNGAAYLRSCLWSPGATKAQTFQSTIGMAMKRPMIIATFMYVQKASVGVVNTSSCPSW